MLLEVLAGGGALLAAGVVRTLFKLLMEWRPAVSTISAAEAEREVFDFVVVGGGSAGAVLAARLVEDPAIRVLILEAGAEDSHKHGSGFFKVPIAALGFQATPYHWGYETESEPELVMKGHHWAPYEGSRGRPLIQTRGKVLGGSSSINLCNYIRGHPDDFDRWRLPGWGFRQMLSYFRRAEQLGTSAVDGGGEIASTPPTTHEAAIAVGDIQSPHPISTAFVAGCARWLGRRPDAPHPQASSATSPMLQTPSEGAGLHCVTVRDGIRCSNAAALRTDAARAAIEARRLVVITEARALHVVLDSADGSGADADGGATGGATTCARGVVARCADGEIRRFAASREVLLCAGAVNTPQLLLLSGVGPEDELRAVGITPKLHQPHVGRHLRDVAAVGLCMQTGLATLDKQLRTVWPYLHYLLTRSGPLASNTLEASAFLGARHLPPPGDGADSAGGIGSGGGTIGKSADDDGVSPVTAEAVTDGSRSVPHADGARSSGRPWLQLLVQPMLFPFASWGKFRDFVAQLKAGTLPSAFSVHVVLLDPKSSGAVTLEQRSPLAAPLITHNYLQHPADLGALVHGIRLTRAILQQCTELRVGGEILPGPAIESEDQLREYVRANACHFNGSLCGSCRMASNADEGARSVLDPAQ